MSRYVRAQPYATTFDGDEVKCLIAPIELSDGLDFLDAFKSKEPRQVLSFYQRVLPKYVSEFSGLRDKAGAEVSLEDVLRVSYFARLVTELGGVLSRSSGPLDPLEPVELSNGSSADTGPSKEIQTSLAG